MLQKLVANQLRYIGRIEAFRLHMLVSDSRIRALDHFFSHFLFNELLLGFTLLSGRFALFYLSIVRGCQRLGLGTGARHSRFPGVTSWQASADRESFLGQS